MYAKKNSGKKLTMVLVAIILVMCCTIGGTLAWLTAQTNEVTNTFTVGDINIKLDETTGSEYKIVPGGSSAKDPKVTVVEGSEKCYVYALVTNTVKVNGTVVATPDIDTPDTWSVVKTEGDKTLYRYYQVVDASAGDVECQVFTTVEYSDSIVKADIATLTGTKIIIDAYAHQSENITDVSVADTEAKTHFGFSTT